MPNTDIHPPLEGGAKAVLSGRGDTPMMVQFYATKERYPDSILFFRMGDFYEMFADDANVAAKILGITLTSRNKQSENAVPMCGVPYHAYKSYAVKLIHAGYKVAICDQLEDPALTKGLVKRGVTRVITPGTVMEMEEIADHSNNFLVAIYQDATENFIAAVDISTGELYLSTATDAIEGISSYEPKEVLCSVPMHLLGVSAPTQVHKALSVAKSTATAIDRFKVSSLATLGIEEPRFSVPLAMLLGYIDEAMIEVSLARPVVIAPEARLVVDKIASRTLELTDGAHSLYSILNKTSTPMGARMLKWWLLHPSREIKLIDSRLDMVEFFVKEWGLTIELERLLASVYDIERIAGRIASRRVSPRELVWLKSSLMELPRIADILEGTGLANVQPICEGLLSCQSIGLLIEQSIMDTPSQTLKDGGLIRDGYSKQVDELRYIKDNGRNMLASLESRLRASTGINQLKVSYNKVFGFYIEVSKANLSKVPSDFERKQTLVNAERFITQELKELENKVLSAEERLFTLEYELFCSIREMIAENTDLLRKTARDIAELDTYLSLARVAVMNRYVRPTVDDSGVIDVSEARHPVVESVTKEIFVANNIQMDVVDNRFILLTGPNMAGKSTYIRSVALVCIMAHIGGFVPATKARIGLIDRIFTRVGASDNISRGESTFMVEMVETANILSNATSKSLIVLDEIGRGTSTFDGVSIAWAVTEYLLKTVGAKTLFATHYHELTDIASQGSGARNYTMLVREQGGEIIFMRQVVEGTADKSYGIYVGKLAGLPSEVVKRAEEVLAELESDDTPSHHKVNEVLVRPILIFDEEHPAVVKLKEIDINSLTPVSALNILAELKKTII
jgi:DNA mismatch repair protein MutS